jgi:hypothetical protein
MYVFKTWVVANLINPFIFCLAFGLDDSSFSGGVIGFGFDLFAIFLIYSIPSLIMSWLLMALIDKLPFNMRIKYFVWLFLVPVLPVINLMLLDGGDYNYKSAFEFAWPAVIAVFLTVIIRTKYFFKRLNNKNTQHETNMV